MYGNKRFERRLIGAAIAAAALMSAPLVQAATADGVVGATSTGTVDVQINVGNLVLVENLNPIVLNYTPGGGDVVAVESFCVWATTGTLYDITISSAPNPTGTSTFIAQGAASSVNYTVDFDDDPLGTTWEAVTEGATLNNGGPGYTPANGVPAGCAADNAALQVTAVETANLDVAAADSYLDELTLLVTPL